MCTSKTKKWLFLPNLSRLIMGFVFMNIQKTKMEMNSTCFDKLPLISLASKSSWLSIAMSSDLLNSVEIKHTEREYEDPEKHVLENR